MLFPHDGVLVRCTRLTHRHVNMCIYLCLYDRTVCICALLFDTAHGSLLLICCIFSFGFHSCTLASLPLTHIHTIYALCCFTFEFEFEFEFEFARVADIESRFVTEILHITY